MTNATPDVDKKIISAEKLANKKINISVIVSLFLPFAGYIYTGRWLSVCICLVLWFIIVGSAESTAEGGGTILSLIIGIVAAIDNLTSINRAKRLVQSVNEQKKSTTHINHSDELRILKILRQHSRGMSLADIIIETELPSQVVKEIVIRLEKDDLVRSYNRSDDGALIYKIV